MAEIEFKNDRINVGMHILFDNGLTLSVQNGETNYCENRFIYKGPTKQVEIAVWDNLGEWITKEVFKDLKLSDDVIGFVSVDKLPEIMLKVKMYGVGL